MRFLTAAVLALIAAPSLGAEAAKTFPVKTLRLVVGLAAGGGVDATARIVASKLGEVLGQNVIVENRPGAGGSIGAGIVAKAAPDGYTLFFCGSATHAIGPALGRLPYDHLQDFTPISLIGTSPNVLVVHPSMPARTVKEFIVYARSRPGNITYGSSGIGTTPHLSMELFRAMTRIEVVHVPYKGIGPAQADLIGGHLLSMFGNLPGQLGMIRAGGLRALGITSATRNPQLPDVPTIMESGVPNYEVIAWYGICGPAALPRPVLMRLSSNLWTAINLSEVQRRLEESGLDPALSSPLEFAAFMKSETVKWAKVVKYAGIVAERP